MLLALRLPGAGCRPGQAEWCECRTRGNCPVDRTRYGSTRTSPKSYFVHHTQRITKAAVMHDAKAILKQVVVLKQRCLRTGTATHAATAGGGA